MVELAEKGGGRARASRPVLRLRTACGAAAARSPAADGPARSRGSGDVQARLRWARLLGQRRVWKRGGRVHEHLLHGTCDERIHEGEAVAILPVIMFFEKRTTRPAAQVNAVGKSSPYLLMPQ